MTGWKFYFSGANSVKEMFDFWNNIKPLPNLAKGILTLNAEAVYKAPADYNEIIQWSISFEVNLGSYW